MKSVYFVSLALHLLFSSFALAASTSYLCNNKQYNQISFSNRIEQLHSVNEITLLVWNGFKYSKPGYFEDLKRLSSTADIVMIQEAMHSDAWQAAFASHMPLSYSFHKSFCDFDQQATGVMTGARYPLKDSLTITSRGTEPGSFTPKVSGYSKLEINGIELHLINTHALNFNVGGPFEQQIDDLVLFISKLNGPVIWAGDFNTWSPGRKNYLNIKARSVGLQHLDPMTDHRILVLDHIYVRGLKAKQTEVLKEQTSDHDPLRTVLQFE